ncbi:MAG: hypothetical protein WCT12_31430, partial [Verrucomicrobiota bacterium]
MDTQILIEQGVAKHPVQRGCSKMHRCKARKNRRGWRIGKYVERRACQRNEAEVRFSTACQGRNIGEGDVALRIEQ